MIVECKKCGGKGHVFEKGSLFCGPFIWLIGLLETNDEDGLTRLKCERCDGKGYIKIKEEDL